jgi:hypothetical protein
MEWLKNILWPIVIIGVHWHISEFVKAAESLEKCRAEFCVRGLKGHG